MAKNCANELKWQATIAATAISIPSSITVSHMGHFFRLDVHITSSARLTYIVYEPSTNELVVIRKATCLAETKSSGYAWRSWRQQWHCGHWPLKKRSSDLSKWYGQKGREYKSKKSSARYYFFKGDKKQARVSTYLKHMSCQVKRIPALNDELHIMLKLRPCIRSCMQAFIFSFCQIGGVVALYMSIFYDE